ncbi:MAG: hypothetical protein M3Y20_08740 [Actinomycetota bacterium]|nr:hypothetical protein [Actinomycetota bacterium]
MRHPADRKAVALPEVPGLGRTYLRTLAARGSSRGELESVEVRVDDVRVDADHLADYQRVVGEPVSDVAPAGYLFVLSFPLALSVMTRKGFPLRALGMVHVKNRIVQNHPVRIGDSLGLRTWAQDLRARRSGTQVDLVTQALDADGDVAWEQVSTFLAKGARIEGLPAADDDEPRAEFSPPVPTARWELPADTGRRYAAVSGDRNPIHLNPLLAKGFGFPRTIAHGMYTAGRVLASVGAARGEAYVWEVTFGRPVLLPSTVAVRVAGPEVGAEPATGGRRGSRAARSEPAGSAARPGFELAVWDPRSGKPHLSGSLTPIR